jgi:PAS domain-containing protein
MGTMKQICAWCNREISADSGQSDNEISHGICEECRDYFFPRDGPPTLGEFLDMLPVPVLVVDYEVKVISANDKALKLLGKESGKIAGMYAGEAVECPYARLAEGCGTTVHCRSCAIRLNVLDTYRTGQSHYDVPAYQDVSFSRRDKDISFFISTWKTGEFVLLRIHEVKGKDCEQ